MSSPVCGAATSTQRYCGSEATKRRPVRWRPVDPNLTLTLTLTLKGIVDEELKRKIQVKVTKLLELSGYRGREGQVTVTMRLYGPDRKQMVVVTLQDEERVKAAMRDTMALMPEVGNAWVAQGTTYEQRQAAKGAGNGRWQSGLPKPRDPENVRGYQGTARGTWETPHQGAGTGGVAPNLADMRKMLEETTEKAVKKAMEGREGRVAELVTKAMMAKEHGIEVTQAKMAGQLARLELGQERQSTDVKTMRMILFTMQEMMMDRDRRDKNIYEDQESNESRVSEEEMDEPEVPLHEYKTPAPKGASPATAKVRLRGEMQEEEDRDGPATIQDKRTRTNQMPSDMMLPESMQFVDEMAESAKVMLEEKVANAARISEEQEAVKRVLEIEAQNKAQGSGSSMEEDGEEKKKLDQEREQQTLERQARVERWAAEKSVTMTAVANAVKKTCEDIRGAAAKPAGEEADA